MRIACCVTGVRNEQVKMIGIKDGEADYQGNYVHTSTAAQMAQFQAGMLDPCLNDSVNDSEQ